MTVLGTDKLNYKKQITHFIFLLIVVSVAVIAANVLLAVFRTDTTHTVFLIINIITDIALLWGIIWTVIVVINPKRKLLSLYERGEKSGKNQIGKVIRFSEKCERFQGFTCREVTVGTGNSEYKIYFIEGSIELKTDITYKLQTVENLIISAEEVK